ncbi:glycoside hydrolase/deacetylase [Massarina eburnea CBS 473.64]|uniref:Glycoside hydrolase/deacetylase n=1 Tax=Massarina eburnea CBS 473.64 TaxID=1395130 RepID=A0A6A6SB72_9PLEO|nr:glycoside hydrolase/deacetylase [Massarina eburnea CBS 473.64]
MRFSTALATVAAVAPIVNAHGGHGLPQIAGLNLRDLKTRDMLSTLRARVAEIAAQESHESHAAHEERSSNIKRQGGDSEHQCGEGKAACAAGYCCSVGGYCGNTADYCYSPGCQYKYGPGCPENITPAGDSTASVARDKLGSVEYGGAGIYQCTQPGTIALTYDDGPLQNYTDHVLDVFKSYNAKATFFISGNNINKGEIDTTPEHKASIQRMHTEGHQIASHTWTHLDLSAVSTDDRKAQLIKNEMALRNILGFFPTYMRPPYSSCTSESGCEQDLADLGYHVTYFNVDTDDYNQDAADKIQNAKNNFQGNITQNGATPANNQWLSIAHDIHYQTAYNLTEFMLSTLTNLGYKPVTVGECLGDPSTNWYRTSAAGGGGSISTTTSAPQPTGTQSVSTDGTCGGTTGSTCQSSTFGNCCSVSGWCGSTTDYCGTDCQTGFGTCGTTGTTTTAVSTTATPTSSAKPVSSDGTCAGTAGQTCQGSSFGNCCSQYGWCGSTTDHCTASSGCNAAFGTCS